MPLKPFLTGYDRRRYRGGAIRIHLKVTTIELAKLFDTTRETVRRWIRGSCLDPTSLTDIVSKYNNRALLDRRRKNKY